MWRSIETYEKPNGMWDIDHPRAIFYDGKKIVIGRCLMDDDGLAVFYYDQNMTKFEPTYWMPLPDAPTKG